MSDKIDDKSFVHLHVHSFYSLLDGLSAPKKLVEIAVENGFKALAITDHGCCGGLLVFQKACKDAGIKPILGCEMYITNDMMFKEKTSINNHLILLAKNSIGLRNLMRLSSIAEIDGKYRKPRIDFATLEKHHEGLICTSACPNGELSNLIFNDKEKEAEELALKYKSLFGEDYYIEVMRHTYNEKEKAQEKKEYDLSIKLYSLGNKLGIKVIATNDVHYAKRSDFKYHDILLSIQTIDTIKNPERFTFNSEDFYLKQQSEMLELFKDMPDTVYNTVEIANKVEDNLLKKSDDLLPVFKIPDGFTDEKHYLKELVRDGMKAKGLINKPEYRERIRFEMDLIIKCNYVRYFLILWDILNFAKREKIRVGAGRGSAVGSLCLYVLDVTKLDPIKYGLLFERFINPDRISPPDVDIDFEYFRRSEVVDYVYRKYGQDHCAKIGTFNALKSRAAIRGVSKALDLGRDWNTYQEELKRAKPDPVTGKKEKVELKSEKSLKIADYLAKLVPRGPDVSIDAALRESTEFRDAIGRYPDLLDCILHIEKTVAYSGVHAAGIVVCKDPISDHVPLRESKDQICTQFVGPEVEELGLLKFDFLGLKTLTVIDETLKFIKDRHGKDIDIDGLDPVDPKVLSLFNGSYPNMDNRGIFQFESPGISSMLKNIQVDVFEDLIVSNALYRPGPLEANVPDLYADYKHGRKKIVYLHPKMGEILKDTYGLMCFDKEQKIYFNGNYGNIIDVKKQNNVASFIGENVRFRNPVLDSFSNGEKDVFEYKLSNGFSIFCTDNHRVLCSDGNREDVWNEIDFVYKNNLPILYKVNEDMVEKEYDEKKAKRCYFIGMLIGDGALGGSSVNLCCGKSRELAEKMASLYEYCFDGVKGVVYFSTRCWYVRLTTEGNDHRWGMNKKSYIKDFLSDIGLKGDFKNKRIPIDYFENNREYYRAFLAGYLDSDGCLCKDVRFTSSNDTLLEQTAYILWNMGYHSYRSCHFLIVNDSQKLWEEIKKYSHKKTNNRLSDGSSLQIDSNLVRGIILSKVREEKISYRKFCKKYNLNRSTVNRILKRALPFSKYQAVKNIISKYDFNKNTCLFIKDKIVIGKKEVFDLSMKQEDGNNFIIQPGVVAHNCYQEDFMKVSQSLAGFTKGQSDTLRKIVGKKKPELIKKEKLDEKFVEGCTKNGIAENISKEIFKQIEYFGGYGFNKSHSAAYSFIAYQTAYLKVYYPIEFMCSLLTSEIDNADKNEKLMTYINEAKRMGIIIMKSNVNRSKNKYIIEKGSDPGNGRTVENIRSPLTVIDGVGGVASESIISNQPYKNLMDFLFKLNGAKVNIRVFKSLLTNGCFDESWKLKSDDAVAQYEESRSASGKKKQKSIVKQMEYINSAGDSLLCFGGEDFDIKL